MKIFGKHYSSAHLFKVNMTPLLLCKVKNGITTLLVYVDDIIIMGSYPDSILQPQQSLHASFHMKDLGPLTYFLGLEVHKLLRSLFIDQHKYTMDLI